jgi:hypothetical protein
VSQVDGFEKVRCVGRRVFSADGLLLGLLALFEFTVGPRIAAAIEILVWVGILNDIPRWKLPIYMFGVLYKLLLEFEN